MIVNCTLKAIESLGEPSKFDHRSCRVGSTAKSGGSQRGRARARIFCLHSVPFVQLNLIQQSWQLVFLLTKHINSAHGIFYRVGVQMFYELRLVHAPSFSTLAFRKSKFKRCCLPLSKLVDPMPLLSVHEHLPLLPRKLHRQHHHQLSRQTLN